MAKGIFAKNRKASTPPFTASWPALTEQSVYEGDETGRYEVKMVLSKDSETYKKMKALIGQAVEDGKEAYGDDWNLEYTPFKDYKEKNEDGEYEVNPDKVNVIFRAGAKRKDKVTGKKKVVKLTIFDQYGDVWDYSQKITGGSTIQVSYETNPYQQKAGKNIIEGVQFRMKGVKVLELADYSGDTKDDFEFVEKPIPTTNVPAGNEDYGRGLDIPF